MKYIYACIFLLCLTAGRRMHAQSRQDSLNGSITPERDWWKLLHYDLHVTPDYQQQSISGRNSIRYRCITPGRTHRMQIDLLSPLHIDSVLQQGKKLTTTRDEHIWYIHTPPLKQNETATVDIYYSGQPKVSVKPPWDGGVVWSQDVKQRPWIAVACQLSGARVWYPCKNHQYDEPSEGVDIHITVPDTLMAVANGRLQGTQPAGNGWQTYSWRVTAPINHYGITFYIGKYLSVQEVYQGEQGPMDMKYWVLDYNLNKATDYLQPEVRSTMKSFEHWFGPYPFYKDGFQIVEAPYIGMEHQSAIAYGNQFTKGRYLAKKLSPTDLLTDRLVVHEMAHEWWGNSITTKDFTERWIQEGFAAYAEQLRMEDLVGRDSALIYMLGRRRYISNKEPLIRRYHIYEDGGEDMYLKGCALVEQIRILIDNDTRFRQLLRNIQKEMYHQVITSPQLEQYISKAVGKDLSSVFDQYLRHTELPVLAYRFRKGRLQYRWEACRPGFNMPVKIAQPITTWLYPSDQWQSQTLNAQADSIQVDKSMFINVKQYPPVEPSR